MPKLHSTIKKDRAHKLFNEGKSAYMIAKTMKLPESTVRDWVCRWRGLEGKK